MRELGVYKPASDSSVQGSSSINGLLERTLHVFLFLLCQEMHREMIAERERERTKEQDLHWHDLFITANTSTYKYASK